MRNVREIGLKKAEDLMYKSNPHPPQVRFTT